MEAIIADKGLFSSLLKHRSHYVAIKKVQYDGLVLSNLKFTPPAKVLDLYRRDYKDTLQQMIYGEAADFDSQLEELQKLQDRLGALNE